MSELPDPFFRREYGRLVAMLSRRVGVHHVEAIEDAVQRALATALETWTKTGLPDNPPAWLYRVAYNQLLGELRDRARRSELTGLHAALLVSEPAAAPSAALSGDVRDDLLRMLFACCDESLPAEAQLVLALKVLCGFDVREIAERLFLSEASVRKRLDRARRRLREAGWQPTQPAAAARLPAVHAILYVLFTEGHLSSRADAAIRRELCDEALWLALQLAEHPTGAAPETFALLALMHLHLARLPARQHGSGGLLLLEEQDRTRWDARHIASGLTWLARSAQGDTFSRYHAEAGVAAEHCLAPTFEQTRWDRIVACYALLDRLAPSALHTLNRALALAEWQGPQAGLALLEALSPPARLAQSHWWSAVLADLHGRAGHAVQAAELRARALACAPSAAVREALERRLRAR